MPPQRGSMPVTAPLRDNVEVRTTAAYTAEPDAGRPPSVFVAMPEGASKIEY